MHDFLFIQIMNYKRYPKSIIIIHLLTLMIFVIAVILGLSLKNLEFSIQNIGYYRLKAALGLGMILLTVVRIYIKRKNPYQRPPNIKYFNTFHRKFMKLIYYLIYFFLIFVPIMGLILLYQSGALIYEFGNPPPGKIEFDPTLLMIHRLTIFSLIVFISIHIINSIFYLVVTKHNICKRIFP